MPPAQPNGMVFYKVSLTMQEAQTDHEIMSLILNDTNVVLRKLEKYTSYLLKISPATENGVSEMHTASLHIRTEEDGMFHTLFCSCSLNIGFVQAWAMCDLEYFCEDYGLSVQHSVKKLKM